MGSEAAGSGEVAGWEVEGSAAVEGSAEDSAAEGWEAEGSGAGR